MVAFAWLPRLQPFSRLFQSLVFQATQSPLPPVSLPPCSGWTNAPVVCCLWLPCLEDLTWLFQVLVLLVLWQPSLAESSSLWNSSGLARVLGLALVVDCHSRSSSSSLAFGDVCSSSSSIALATSGVFALADTWKLLPLVGRAVVAA